LGFFIDSVLPNTKEFILFKIAGCGGGLERDKAAFDHESV
jgi:hypothetical protein